MEIIITFAIGRLLYSLIGQFQIRFLALEVVLTIAYVGTSLLLIKISNIEARSVAIGVVFIATGILSRVMHGKPPVEAPGKWVVVGIIDFAWLAIMGAALTIVAFGRSVSPFVDSLPQIGLKQEYYQKTYDTIQFLLGQVINTVPLLGATLGACMGILWAGELWAKKGNEANVKYKNSTIAAIRMVVAFFVVEFAILYWLGVPLYTKLFAITEYLK